MVSIKNQIFVSTVGTDKISRDFSEFFCVKYAKVDKSLVPCLIHVAWEENLVSEQTLRLPSGPL